MSYLPPVGWADVATSKDVMLLRGEVAALGTALRAGTATLGSTLRTEIADLRTEIAELRTTQATELKNHLYWIIGTMIGLTGLISIIVGWLR